MLIPGWFLKYVVTFNVAYWPLHALGVANGLAFAVAFATWPLTFEFFRRRRKRLFYERLALEQLAAEQLGQKSE